MDVAVEGAEKLVLVLGLLPLVGFIVYKSIMKMIDGEFGLGAGLVAILSTFGVLGMAAFANHPLVSIAVFVGLSTLAATYPFALDQLSRTDHARIDLMRLDRAYQAYCARPDNTVARFAVASALADHGLLGHAAVVAEETLETLSNEIDPITNQSMRAIFRNQEFEAKKWRREARPADFRPVKCPRCGTLNEAGNLFCKECKALHLLDLARGDVSSARIVPKLVVTWAVLALVVGGVALSAEHLSPRGVAGVVAGGLAVAGVVLGLLFRPGRMRG